MSRTLKALPASGFGLRSTSFLINPWYALLTASSALKPSIKGANRSEYSISVVLRSPTMVVESVAPSDQICHGSVRRNWRQVWPFAHYGKQVLRFNGALSMFCLWEGSVVQKSTAELSVQWTTARQHGQEFGLFPKRRTLRGTPVHRPLPWGFAWLKTWWMFACSHCTCCSPMQPYYWTWFFCNFPQCCIISIFVISTMISFSSFFSTLFLHIPIMVVGFSQFLVKNFHDFSRFFFSIFRSFPKFFTTFFCPPFGPWKDDASLLAAAGHRWAWPGARRQQRQRVGRGWSSCGEELRLELLDGMTSGGWQRMILQVSVVYTLWLFNIAMENSPFLIGKPSINGPFSNGYVK